MKETSPLKSSGLHNSSRNTLWHVWINICLGQQYFDNGWLKPLIMRPSRSEKVHCRFDSCHILCLQNKKLHNEALMIMHKTAAFHESILLPLPPNWSSRAKECQSFMPLLVLFHLLMLPANCSLAGNSSCCPFTELILLPFLLHHLAYKSFFNISWKMSQGSSCLLPSSAPSAFYHKWEKDCH